MSLLEILEKIASRFGIIFTSPTLFSFSMASAIEMESELVTQTCEFSLHIAARYNQQSFDTEFIQGLQNVTYRFIQHLGEASLEEIAAHIDDKVGL